MLGSLFDLPSEVDLWYFDMQSVPENAALSISHPRLRKTKERTLIPWIFAPHKIKLIFSFKKQLQAATPIFSSGWALLTRISTVLLGVCDLSHHEVDVVVKMEVLHPFKNTQISIGVMDTLLDLGFKWLFKGSLYSWENSNVQSLEKTKCREE